MNTGLTDKEKELLLKFFLTHCEINQLDNVGIVTHEVRFFNSPDKVGKNVGDTIIKAMNNLRNSVFM